MVRRKPPPPPIFRIYRQTDRHNNTYHCAGRYRVPFVHAMQREAKATPRVPLIRYLLLLSPHPYAHIDREGTLHGSTTQDARLGDNDERGRGGASRTKSLLLSTIHTDLLHSNFYYRTIMHRIRTDGQRRRETCGRQ
jgi:hypothetical protein